MRITGYLSVQLIASQGSHPLHALLSFPSPPLPSPPSLLAVDRCVQSVTRLGCAFTNSLPYTSGDPGSRPSSMMRFVMELAKHGR